MAVETNPLGIINTVYGGIALEPMAQAVAAHGLTHLQLDPRTPAVAGGEAVTPQRAREVRRILAEHGITIAGLAGYTNLVDPDPARRERELRTFEHLIEVCREFGTTYIATETGSLHPESPWEDYAANHTPDARAQVLAVLERLLRRARGCGVTILIEGYVNNVIATTEEASRLVDDLGPEGLGFVLDPFNYCTREDEARPREALERIFTAIGGRAPIAHAKDLRYGARGIDTPKAGDGRMDWPAYAALLQRHAPGVPLMLEHLAPAEVARCKAFVADAFVRAGRGS